MSKGLEDDLQVYLQVIARNISERQREVDNEEATSSIPVEQSKTGRRLGVSLSASSLDNSRDAETAVKLPHKFPSAKKHSKQHSLPVFTHHSSPHARGGSSPRFFFPPTLFFGIREEDEESVQVISELPSRIDDSREGDRFSTPEVTRKVMSPSSKVGLSSTKNSMTTGAEFRTSVTSEDQEPSKRRQSPHSVCISDLQSFRFEAAVAAAKGKDSFGMLPTVAFCGYCRRDVSTRVSVELPKVAR